MLVDRSLTADVRFIVAYFDIPPKVDHHIHLGHSHNFTRAYTYHVDIEHSILAAYHKSKNVNR